MSFVRATASSPRSVTMSVAPNVRASCWRGSWRLMAMIRSAPILAAESTPSRPTAPSPTTATVMPGCTFAQTAANHPVPITSDRESRLGSNSAVGRLDDLRVVALFGAHVPGGVENCSSHGVVPSILVAVEDLLGDGHGGHGLGPSRVEGQVGDGFDQLLLGRAVAFREAEVVDELYGVPARGQARDGDEAAFLRRQLCALPDLTEQDVIGEAHERRCEATKHSLGTGRFVVVSH